MYAAKCNSLGGQDQVDTLQQHKKDAMQMPWSNLYPDNANRWRYSSSWKCSCGTAAERTLETRVELQHIFLNSAGTAEYLL